MSMIYLRHNYNAEYQIYIRLQSVIFILMLFNKDFVSNQ